MKHRIKINLEEVLGDRSLYWLADQTEIAYSTLHNFMNRKTKSIRFETIEKILDVLNCELSDILVVERE